MNVDLIRLLTGGKDALPLNGELTSALSAEDFGITLDEKLADLGLATLPFAAELLAQLPTEAPLAQLPAEVPPPQFSLLAPGEGEIILDANGEPIEDGVTLTDAALPEEVLAALIAEGGEETPQWQLQQLVLHNATGKADAPGIEGVTRTARPTAVEMMSLLNDRAGKVDKPHLAASARAENAPLMVPTSTPQSVPVEMADSATAPTVSVSPLTLPATARPIVQAASLPAVATVSYPPDAPEWKPAISQQIVMFTRNGIHNAEIRLHPEELGSLHITLRLHQDQAQVHIVSEHAHVRQAMEQAMPQLRTAMADSGIQLGQANVSADNPYGSADGQGEQPPGEPQAQKTDEEKAAEEQIVPQLLTTTPGNVYGINTFA